MNLWISRALLLAALTSFVACGGGGGDDDDDDAPAIPGAKSGVVFGLTNDNRLVSFDPGTPTVLITNRTITGLATGDEIVAIDFRPSTGDLYGFSVQDRLYRIDTSTGGATQIGAPLAPALTGTEIGFDFNPVVDRIRLTTDADENLRLHPDTAALLGSDTALAYVVGDDNSGSNPEVTAVAYTNSFAGAGTTTLYGLDVGTNDLVRIGSVNGTPNSPNTGQLTTIGAQLGTLDLGTSGFDISPSGGAFAVGTTGGATISKLFLISLTTGGADAVGNIGSDAVGVDDTVRDLAVAPPSAPLIWALAANNRIVSFRPGTPDTFVSDEVIDSSDLQQSETIVAIDIRPSTGELYGLGSTSRLYKIDKDDNPDATLIGTTAFTPALMGTFFDIDFNPTSDLLRVVSDADQNLALNPTTGVVTSTDVPVVYAAGDPSFGLDPNLGAIAYTNDFSGASTTTVFGIDSDQDKLVMLGSPNGTPFGPGSGILTTIGDLAIDPADQVGLDFSAYGAAWVATSSNPGTSTLYVINTTSGLATPAGGIGAVGGGFIAIDLAVDIPFLPLLVGLTTDNRLVTFRPGALGTAVSSTAITGLATGETVLAIDFRPSTSELYAVGDTSRLYRIDRNTAAVTAIGAPFVPPLDGTAVGMDINPIFDPVRVVTASGQNLRVSPTSGGVAPDAMLAFVAGDPNELVPAHVTAIAYDSNFTGAAATTVWGIDTNLVPPALVRIGSVGGTPNSANTGMVSTIGPLTGVDTNDLAGFDISTYGGGFLVLNPAAGTTSALYSVNFATGAPRLLGNVTAAGATTRLRDIAIVPNGL